MGGVTSWIHLDICQGHDPQLEVLSFEEMGPNRRMEIMKSALIGSRSMDPAKSRVIAESLTNKVVP